jgi:hypothetical protein
VPTTINVKAGKTATLDITVSAPTLPEGEVRHAWLYLTNQGDTLRFPITLVRSQPGVTLDKTCTPAEVAQYGAIDCTITAQNTTFADAAVSIVDDIPPGHPVDEASVVGATYLGDHKLAWDGTLQGAGAPVVDVAPGGLFGYISLAAFGIPPTPCPSNCDDGALVINGLNIDYLGDHYTTAIWSVNGTLELGTASGVASSFANQNLPNPSLPNNVLAPWWTDLNLGAGGNWYIGALTDGVRTWDIFEWAGVPRFGDNSSTFSFQIWLEQGSDNITFLYGPYAGNTGDGTVGAENADGTVGDTWYYDGAGSLPWGTTDLSVFSVPGTPGETHTITFTMSGDKLGPYTNCAELTSDAFQGVNVSCFSGTVLAP